jgi:hypothetical protein
MSQSTQSTIYLPISTAQGGIIRSTTNNIRRADSYFTDQLISKPTIVQNNPSNLESEPLIVQSPKHLEPVSQLTDSEVFDAHSNLSLILPLAVSTSHSPVSKTSNPLPISHSPVSLSHIPKPSTSSVQNPLRLSSVGLKQSAPVSPLILPLPAIVKPLFDQSILDLKPQKRPLDLLPVQSLLHPLVQRVRKAENKKQCTSTGKPIYEDAASELYSINPCPSYTVLNTMKEVSQLLDEEGRRYYRADQHEFQQEWVKQKMNRLTINQRTDGLYWVRHNPKENKGMFVLPWPQVNLYKPKKFTRIEDGMEVYYYVLENSDGQIERKPKARNTGFVVLRAVVV